MPGALYQGPFFVSGIFVRKGTGRGTPDTPTPGTHLYEMLSFPMDSPVISCY